MKIVIENLEFETIIGILDFEREKEQKIVIDMEIEYNYKNKEFVDYTKIADFTVQHIKKNRFYLIEEALESLTDNLKKLYPQITSIKTSLKKPDILKNCSVGIVLEKNF
ncbi:dihydroneopterin aldolase [Nitrosophilus labii]|uniref:dihydroneopterin aldolase n=1 Tax=Nitrosophilus labii TaxID=2706014 RepID=UPI0016572364|nr:dihydroneopterin aldolase [Nitrosophilus labii]